MKNDQKESEGVDSGAQEELAGKLKDIDSEIGRERDKGDKGEKGEKDEKDESKLRNLTVKREEILKEIAKEKEAKTSVSRSAGVVSRSDSKSDGVVTRSDNVVVTRTRIGSRWNRVKESAEKFASDFKKAMKDLVAACKKDASTIMNKARNLLAGGQKENREGSQSDAKESRTSEESPEESPEEPSTSKKFPTLTPEELDQLSGMKDLDFKNVKDGATASSDLPQNLSSEKSSEQETNHSR